MTLSISIEFLLSAGATLITLGGALEGGFAGGLIAAGVSAIAAAATLVGLLGFRDLADKVERLLPPEAQANPTGDVETDDWGTTAETSASLDAIANKAQNEPGVGQEGVGGSARSLGAARASAAPTAFPRPSGTRVCGPS